MDLRGKKLGLLLSTGPEHPNFHHGVRLAQTALGRGVDVYLYCIDEAVRGMDDPRLKSLAARGLKLFACAYGAQQRDLPSAGEPVLAGLSVVSDLMASTDRFLSFNQPS
jgi:hypothetical protein